MKNDSILKRLGNGIFKENPTFVLMLGMCPTLAVTTSAVNGLGMGLTTMVVLALSNLFISILRKIIPDRVRIPAFIVIIASFVTVAELLLKAYIPFLYDALGLYIPLIVVNCIILGRAEAYASKNGPILSLFDGIGMGLGFTVALTIIGTVRELLGAGTCFNIRVLPASYVPCTIFILAPGAFFVLAALTAIQNKIRIEGEKKGKDMSKIQSGCGADCMNCSMECIDPELRAKNMPEVPEKKEDQAASEKKEEPAVSEKKEEPAVSEEKEKTAVSEKKEELAVLEEKEKTADTEETVKKEEEAND